MNAEIKKVWDFFMDPKHFERISPNDLNETLIRASNDKLIVGTDVWLSTCLFIRRSWHARIIKSEPYEFIDTIVNDRIFKNWTHVHTFLAVDEKTTTVVDSIQFECRYGALGKILETIIYSKLPPIFIHRETKTTEILNG